MDGIDLDDNDLDGLLDTLNRTRGVPLVLDEARRQALRGYADVQACPGSGKTTLVGLKLLCLARKWSASRRGICVLTHTNVAKDEILKCLALHPAGHKLRSYPHFIGTIQEFVNSFIALPYFRSEGIAVSVIDDDHCSARLERLAAFGTKAYLANKHSSLSELRYTWAGGTLKLVVPAFPNGSQSDSYKDLLEIKEKLMGEGAFFYSEMYAFAEDALARAPHLVLALRHRFPVVLIDEMQDVQGFQDTLINSIFRVPEVRFQRFGDPDQAIFDGVGGEMPNTSYNASQMQPVAESHRYCPGIATRLRGLSSRKLALTTSCPAVVGDPSPTVILFSAATRHQVLDRFGELVGTLPPGRRTRIKAVGGVAENQADAGDPLNIRTYWPDFDRNHQPRSFKPGSLCEAVRYAMSIGPVAERLVLVLDMVAQVCRVAGVQFRSRSGKMRPPSRAGLADHLRSRDTYMQFRMLIASWMVGPELTEERWAEQVAALRPILDLPANNPAANALLAFDAAPAAVEPAVAIPGNVFTSQGGIRIELATIHSVKGETHDATLFLETKYQKFFDVKEMLPHLLNPALAVPVFDPEHPTTKPSILAGFMKKAYVAASRPRHFLCIAMGRERMTAQQMTDMQALGWTVVDLG
jgi:DNA helicase-2/ATP-dependent DNA helicase PcrA